MLYFVPTFVYVILDGSKGCKIKNNNMLSELEYLILIKVETKNPKRAYFHADLTNSRFKSYFKIISILIAIYL